MRLSLATLGFCAVFAGCVGGPQQGRPTDVRLTDDSLRVRFAGGAICRTPITAGPTVVSGTFEGCRYPFSYRIALQETRNPLRLVLEEVFDAVGLDGALSPLATVVLTDPDGRAYTFASPARDPSDR